MIILQDSQIKKIFHNGDEVKKILDWDGNVIFYKQSGGGGMTNTIKFTTSPSVASSNVFTVTYTDSTQDTVSYSEPSKEYSLSIPTDKTVNKIDFDNTMVDEVKVSCKINLSSAFFTNKPKTIRLLNCDATSSTDLASTFSGYGLDLLEIRKLDVRNITSMNEFFNSSEAKSIILDVLNSSSVNIMSNLFQWANVETLVGLDSLDTSNVTTMEKMFYYCGNLKELDLSNFNTSNVTNMNDMFFKCYSLKSLDLSNFNTSNVYSMHDMFQGCLDLTSLDLSGWDTSKLMGTSYMFRSCYKLQSLDLSNFNTSNVTSMNGMFQSCEGIKSLDLSNFNTSKVYSMDDMFSGCSNLTLLDLSGWNLTKVKSTRYMFDYCNKLTTIRMVGCNQTTIDKIKSALTNADIINQVTIVTE